jgi:hypothetical protein
MVLGKAPQSGPTESFCRSGVGGHFARAEMGGYDALVVRGKASKPVYLFISDHKAGNPGCRVVVGPGYLPGPADALETPRPEHESDGDRPGG